jgi:hypothetical protein
VSENLDITLIAIDVACAVVMATFGLEPLARTRVFVAARHAHAGVCKQANRKQDKENHIAAREPQRGILWTHGHTFTCHPPPGFSKRRRAETFDLTFRNQLITITTGFYADDTFGEIFISTGKTGTDIASVARDAAVAISLALQHGVPIESLGHAITRDRSGAAASILGAVVDAISTKTFLADDR